MKKIIKLLVVFTCLAFVFTCSSLVFASAYENKDFFAADGATLTATDCYTQNGVTGTKLVLSDLTKAQPEIAFLDHLDVSELSKGISFRFLPSTNGQVDVQTVVIVFEDSVDPTQQLAVLLYKGSTWWSVTDTYASVALSDQVKRVDNYGYAKVGDSGINALGYNKYWTADDFMYTTKAARGFGTANSDYPFFAAADGNTSTLSVVYDESKTVKVNGNIIARLDAAAEAAIEAAEPAARKVDFFTHALKTASADPEFDELKSRYTQEYVNNLFSSGKVKVKFRFGDSISTTASTVTIQMLSFGATSLSPFAVTNNYESVANDTWTDASKSWSGEKTYVGAKMDITESCKIELPGTYSRADLANIITYQFLRNGVSDTLPFATSQIIMQSVSNPDEILTIATTTTGWYGDKIATSRVAYTDRIDDAKTSDVAHYITGTTQNLVGEDMLVGSGGYPDRYPKGNMSTSIQTTFAPFYAVVNNKNTHTVPLSFWLEGSLVRHSYQNSTNAGGRTVADLGKADLLAYATANLQDDGDWQQALKAKYTPDYASNLFSANDVKIYLKFTGVTESFGLNIISIGGKDAKAMTGFKKVGAKEKLSDTVAPQITLTSTKIMLNGGFSYQVQDFVRYATASDLLSNATLSVEVEKDGVKIETEQFAVNEESEYVVKFTATDEAGNVATKEIVCERLPLLPKTMKLEIQRGHSYFAALDLPEGMQYSIRLFASSDTEKTSPLASGVAYYDFTQTGAYLLEYSVVTAADTVVYNVALTVEDTTAPVISLAENYATNLVGGMEVGVIGATVTDNGGCNVELSGSETVSYSGNGVTVSATVTKSGQTVEVTNGKFVVSAGEYTVEYKATDSCGNESKKQVSFSVTGDVDAPTISLSGNLAGEVEWGTSVVLPTATVTDNVDKNLVATVKAEVNGVEKTVTSESLVADMAGEWTITWTATDKAGNTATVTRTFVVLEKQGCGCGGTVAPTPKDGAGTLLLGLALVVAVFIIKKAGERKYAKQ